MLKDLYDEFKEAYEKYIIIVKSGKFYLVFNKDAGIILHEDKEYLKYCLKEIERIIHKYKLELNKKLALEILNRDLSF